MGQDFRAMFGHSLSIEALRTLPAMLNSLTPTLERELVESGEPPLIRWSWWEAPTEPREFSEWFHARLREDGVVTLRATRSLWIGVTPHVLELGSWTRWRLFTSNDAVQRALRSIATRIAQSAGAASVFYLADNACTEASVAGDVMFGGGTIEQVAAGLLEVSPPRRFAGASGIEGYFVEHHPFDTCGAPDASPKPLSVRWIPSRTEGIPGATEVAVFADRLALLVDDSWRVFPFVDMVQWPWPPFLWRALDRVGLRRRWRPIGERDAFLAPRDRFFTFYTVPRITVYCSDEVADGHSDTLFPRVRDLIVSGGFATWDRG